MEKNQLKPRAVLYCRVSTKEQVEEGNSLVTQEKHCRDYALKHEYDVAEVFVEQGESAKTADRAELQRLLMFCSDKKNQVSAVIIYKLDRLSRNTDDYSQLRLILRKYKVEIKSTSEYFENTPAGRFMENIIANVAQFDNDVRAERCSEGMKGALREGRYVWMAPVGYDNVRVGGKATIAPNDMAPLVLKSFELIAQRTHNFEEVRVMVTAQGLRLKNGKPLGKAYFYEFIKNPLYMGVIEKFGETFSGRFEAVVPTPLFNQVQRIIKNKGKKMNPYLTDHPDFPLRRFVINEEGIKLTGSWSKGSKEKYPFYRFPVKGGNYNRDEFEKEFRRYMDQYSFAIEHVERLKSKVQEHFNRATISDRKELASAKTRIQEILETQSSLIHKNLKGILTDEVLKVQLNLLEDEMTKLQTFLATRSDSGLDVNEVLELTEEFLHSPSSVWHKAQLPTKLKLQWFEFPQGLVFNGIKFRTKEVTSIFNVKSAFWMTDSTTVDSDFELSNFYEELRRLSEILK